LMALDTAAICPAKHFPYLGVGRVVGLFAKICWSSTSWAVGQKYNSHNYNETIWHTSGSPSQKQAEWRCWYHLDEPLLRETINSGHLP
jgi:hypothetical protein